MYVLSLFFALLAV